MNECEVKDVIVKGPTEIYVDMVVPVEMTIHTKNRITICEPDIMGWLHARLVPRQYVHGPRQPEGYAGDWIPLYRAFIRRP
jgi:hypothetical protein